MMGFFHNETLGTDVLKDYKGYASIKDDPGLVTNKRPALIISSLSSVDKEAECMKEARKCRRALRDINKKSYYLKNPTTHHHRDP